MEFFIKNKNWNELLKREEIVAVVSSDKTPSFKQIKGVIAENLKVPEEVVNVLKIEGRFGRKEFNINAYIYDSKEEKEKAEPKKKAKEEKPVEEKAEEKPSEKKEAETKQEDKKETKQEPPAEEKKIEGKEEKKGVEEKKAEDKPAEKKEDKK